MSKQKKGLVPELRFSEFEKEPNWPCVQLNAVAKRSTSKNKGEKVSRVLTNSAVDGVVDQRDYFEKDIAVKGNLESYYIVDKGDYVYNPRISSTAPVGPISKNKVGKGVMSPLYTVFKFNSKKNDFFEQFFKSSRWHGYLQTISNSGARHDRMSITSSEFMAMPVPNPGDMEQQKIADCLASIDELITLNTQKLDALKDHKKGLMQQLFPAEAETVPKLRFPEFQKSGEWKKITAGEIFSNRVERGVQGLPIYSVTMNEGLVPRTSLERKIDDVAESSANKSVQKGDIVYNMMRMWQGALGVASVRCMVSPAYVVLKPKEKLDSSFFYYLFKRPESLQVLNAHSRGLTEDRLRLYYDDFSKIPLLYPSLSEQRKIASALTSIEQAIETCSAKRSNLMIHKRGLMQKLFPVMGDAV